MRGLIIAEPWISLILGGSKTWELRTRNTLVRETIALIRKGAGVIVGTAQITDVKGPFRRDELLRHSDKHNVPEELLQSYLGAGGTAFAWVLTDALPLERPVPYAHPSGAVTWVRLPDDIIVPPILPTDPSYRAGVSEFGPPRRITIGQGNLNNSHIYLTGHFDYFPSEAFGPADGRLGTGTLLTLEVDGLPDPVLTDIPTDAVTGEPRKFFRKRSWVRQFFEAMRIQPGDEVVIERIDRLRYRVAPARRTDGR